MFIDDDDDDDDDDNDHRKGKPRCPSVVRGMFFNIINSLIIWKLNHCVLK